MKIYILIKLILLKKTKNNYVFEYADKSLENDPDLNEQAQKNLKG